MGARALPDLTSRIVIDSSGLQKAEAAAKGHGAGIASGLKPAEQGAKDAEKGFGSLASRLEGFGEPGGKASGVMKELNSVGSGLGATLGGGVALGAAAAGLAVSAFVASGIHDYVSLADEVRNYSRITGDSAENSSRMISVFNDLGVSAETGTAAMFKLAKAAENTPGKLAAVGVEIAHNKDGAVELLPTFLNVVDAYQRAGTAADRDAIAFAAFGKSGAALIPILAQNRAELQQLADETATVMTQQDLNNAHNYEIQMSRLGQEAHSLGINLAGVVVPAVTGTAQAFNDAFLSARSFHDNLAKGMSVRDAAAASDRAVAASHVDLASKEQDLANKVAETTKQLAAEQKAADALNRALDSLLGNQISEARAELNVKDAAVRATDAQLALTAAIRDYGPNSQQAKAAAETLTKAQLDQEAAIDQAAQASVKQAVDLAAAAGEALNSSQQADLYLASLKTLAANTSGPVHDALATLIAQLDEAAKVREAKFNVSFGSNDPQAFTMLKNGTLGTSATGVGITRAGGGDVVPGRLYKVGEEGSEWFIPKTAGTILPHGQSPEAGSPADATSPSGAGGATYNLTLVGAPAVNDPDGVRRMLDRLAYLGAGS